MGNGKTDSCIPIENISPFSTCYSADAKKALSALTVSAAGETKKRYDAALKIIE